MRTYDILLTGILFWLSFSALMFIIIPMIIPEFIHDIMYYLIAIVSNFIWLLALLFYFIIIRNQRKEITSSLNLFRDEGIQIFTKKYEKLLYSRDIADIPKIGHILFNFNTLAIVQPKNIEELKKIIKFCEKYHIPIIPRGAGTSGYGGVLPIRNGIIINLTLLNKILTMDNDKLTVTVECGITWEHLRRYLEEKGFTLRTYPSSGLSSTVGGWISQGGYGIGSSKYGSIANSVNEVTILGTEGKEFKIQDPRSFVNSCGTLGIIIQAKLSITVLEKLIHITVSSSNQRNIIKAIKTYHNLGPYFLRYIDYQTISWEKQSNPRFNLDQITLDNKGGILAMSFEEKDWNEKDFYSTTHSLNFSILPSTIAKKLWEERFYTLRLKRMGPSLIVAEVLVPIDSIHNVIKQIADRFNQKKYCIEIITSNEKHCILMVWFPTDFRHFSIPIIGSIPYSFHWYRSFEIIHITLKNGGIPYSTGLWLSPYAKSVLKGQLREFKKIKKQIDPNHIFNPGKVWGTRVPRFLPIIPWFFVVRIIFPIISVLFRIIPKKFR